jgi:hypothetical protein
VLPPGETTSPIPFSKDNISQKRSRADDMVSVGERGHDVAAPAGEYNHDAVAPAGELRLASASA